jgi:hypothetical protein
VQEALISGGKELKQNFESVHVLARLLVILKNIVSHTFFEKVLNHFKRDAIFSEIALSPLPREKNQPVGSGRWSCLPVD